MKKLLSITLIGLLSLFIHSISIAEPVEGSPSQAGSSDTVTTTEPAESTINSDTNDMNAENSQVTTDTSQQSAGEPPAMQEQPVEEKAMPKILGEPVELHSLRGDNDVDAVSELFPNRRTMAVDGGIDVSYEEQPPMIPHNIDKDRISLQENSCLKCHSRADSKLEDAPKPPKSHFIKRDGTRTDKVSTGRYFCTQCHAPQVNKKPVIKNTFKN